MPLIGAQGPGSNISWRGNLDEYPDEFIFPPENGGDGSGVLPGLAYTSSPVTVTGINYKALFVATLNEPLFALNAGVGVSVRVTPYIEETDSYGTVGDFVDASDSQNNPVIIRNKDKVELEVLTLSANVVGRDAFNVIYGIGVTIGKRTGDGWTVKTRELDDDPDFFDFTDLDNLEINTLQGSDVVTVTGIDDIIGVDVFIVGNGELRINGGSWTQTAKIFDGDTLQLRNTTSNFYNTSVTTLVQLGIFQANWNITTRLADTSIDPFTFTDVVDVDLSTVHESNIITISGADENLNGNNPLPITFTSPNSSEYRITRGGSVVQEYTTASTNTCNNGDTIQIKQTASSSYSTTTDATLTVANQSDTYSVTTRPRPIDTIPSAFVFTDQTNVLRNELIYSNIITLNGMTTGDGANIFDEGTASIAADSAVEAKFKVTRGGTVVQDWTSGTFGVRQGDQIQLRLLSATTSQGTRSATFTVSGTNTFSVIAGVPGSTSDTWNVTSKARDCGITAFSLTDVPQGTSTLVPGQQAQTEFTVGGSFEFDCNITATTSNTNSYLKKKGTNVQGTTLNDLKQGDIVEIYMTTPYYCSTRSTTISLSAAFATSGSNQSDVWTISPPAPPLPTLNLTASNLNPPFVFPDGGSTTINYEYTHVTNSAVTSKQTPASSGGSAFTDLTSITPTTLADQTKTGSKNVTNLINGQTKFELTVSNCTGSTTDTINVIVGTPPSPTLFFCATSSLSDTCSKQVSIKRNNSKKIYWSSTNAIKVQAIQGTGFSTGNKQSGNDTVTPATDGEVYIARAVGAGSNPDEVDKSITFNFSPSVTLTANPTSIITGQSTKLSWNIVDADQITSSSGQDFTNVASTSSTTTTSSSSSTTITGSTITVTDQSYTLDGVTYPVRGRLWVPTSVTNSSVDAVVAYPGTLSLDTSASATTILTSANTMVSLLKGDDIAINDKIIFGVAYPQDGITPAQNINLLSQADLNSFEFGDNLPYARAALLWVKNNLNTYLSSNNLSKTRDKVYMFGHSQGGSLVHKLNTLETTDGVIANAPGPIRLDITCSAQESNGLVGNNQSLDANNITCQKMFDAFGSATTAQEYKDVSLLYNYVTGHKAKITYLQSLDDTTGGTGSTGQVTWMNDLTSAMTSNSQNYEYITAPTGGHDGFYKPQNTDFHAAIQNVVGSTYSASQKTSAGTTSSGNAQSGNKNVTPSTSGTFTYTMTVRNSRTGETDQDDATVKVTNDTTVDNYNMNPSSKTNVNRGSAHESQPQFVSSPQNSVHGLSPNVTVTATISGGGAKFLDGTTSKSGVKNGTSCSSLRIKMNASNSFNTQKTATMNIGGVQRTFKVKTLDCTVSNGTFSLGGCTLKTRQFKSTNGVGGNRQGVIGVSGCSGTTGGNREKVTKGTIDRFANDREQNSTFTLPTGTSTVEAKGIAGGGGGGKQNTSDEGAGGGGGGGAFKIEWNNAEGGDVIKFFAGRGGKGATTAGQWDDKERPYPGGSGQDSWVEIKGKNISQRIRSEGGEAGDEKNGGVGGKGAGGLPGQPTSWFGGNGGQGSGRRGDEGGHGGGAGRIYASEPENSSNECQNGVADPGSQRCSQGGPGQGSQFNGNCSGSNRQEKGTQEGARGNQWGGGGSGGGCGNGGGDGGAGAVAIVYTIQYTKYNKTDVFKRINRAFWDKRNYPATQSQMTNWYNNFKDKPQNYPTLGSLYNAIVAALGTGTKATGVTDNCGNAYPKYK